MRDRAVELEAMKAQLAHIKALMEENDVRLREPVDSSELEQDVNAEVDVNGEGAVDGITEDVANISFDCRSDSDDIGHGKFQNSVPTIEDIQVIITIIIQAVTKVWKRTEYFISYFRKKIFQTKVV